MMEPFILTVEAAMHIVFEMPCLLICQEKLLEMHYTEDSVSDLSHENLEDSKTGNGRPTFGRWTSEK